MDTAENVSTGSLYKKLGSLIFRAPRYPEKENGSLPAFITCKACKRRSTKAAWAENYYVCPECGAYRPVSADYRLSLILDPGSRKDLDSDLSAQDPLDFPEYKEKVKKQEMKTGLKEAAVTAIGRIEGQRIVVGNLDSRFFMGSMSAAVGEKITRAVEYADKNRLPLILFSASGGARMQEGIYSLMQMAKTAAAVQAFSEHGGLYISILTNPTTGGVTASFATLGDITLAEPQALIGFAGPRVIEQTIGRKLPKGFQRAEYLYEHGFVDAIVERKDLRATLAKLLLLHERKY